MGILEENVGTTPVDRKWTLRAGSAEGQGSPGGGHGAGRAMGRCPGRAAWGLEGRCGWRMRSGVSQSGGSQREKHVGYADGTEPRNWSEVSRDWARRRPGRVRMPRGSHDSTPQGHDVTPQGVMPGRRV